MALNELETQLASLKDTSELMIALAYSAYLYNNLDLADDVIELEQYMDDLHTRFELAVMTGTPTNIESSVRDGLGLIRLSIAAESIADAATRIATIVKEGTLSHPVFKLVIDEAEEVITRCQINPQSVLANRSLSELGLEYNIGMWIIAVRQKGAWIPNPPRSYVLAPGDIIIAQGYASGKAPLEKLASGSLQKI